MRRNLAVALGTMVVLAGAGVSLASTDEMIKADIPFAFTLAGKEMPAGNYQVFAADSPNPGAWVVRSTDGIHEEMAVTESVDALRAALKTELVFDVIGQQHFLRKLYFEGENSGLEFAATSAERALEAKGSVKTEHRLAGERAPHHRMTSTKAKS